MLYPFWVHAQNSGYYYAPSGLGNSSFSVRWAVPIADSLRPFRPENYQSTYPVLRFIHRRYNLLIDDYINSNSISVHQCHQRSSASSATSAFISDISDISVHQRSSAASAVPSSKNPFLVITSLHWPRSFSIYLRAI